MANLISERLDYDRKDILGQGAYGVVFKGKLKTKVDKDNGIFIDVAIKRLEIDRRETRVSWGREMTLKNLTHPNVVQVYVEEKDQYFL